MHKPLPRCAIGNGCQQQNQQHATTDTATGKDVWPGQQHPLWQFNAYCSILLYGTLVQESVQRFTALSEALASARSTAVRRRSHLDGLTNNHVHDDTDISFLQSQVSGGPVVMGITPVAVPEINPGFTNKSDSCTTACNRCHVPHRATKVD
jgi:hypothetical protein